MKKGYSRLLLLAAMTIGLLMPTAGYAWDTAPDEEGLYDGLYDRPTYFPDWEQPNTWPNTMYVLCDVRKESASGSRIASYEIAVYDQNNTLRHCNRSLAKQEHLCVLTIPGEDGVDNFHFQVLYGSDFTNPIIVDISDVTLPFETNRSIGTSAEPFLLIVPESTTGVEGTEPTENGVRKVLRDGRLIIERAGKKYDSTGLEI